MDKKAVAINFTFENCEHGTVPMEFVSNFIVGKISKSLFMYSQINQPRESEYEVSGEIYVKFEKSFCGYQGTTQIEDSLLIDRIKKYNDICWFGVEYSDGSRRDFMVEWMNGSGDYENLGQKVIDTKDGLVLEINYPDENKDA